MASYRMYSLFFFFFLVGPFSPSIILFRFITEFLFQRTEAWPPSTGAQGLWERPLARVLKQNLRTARSQASASSSSAFIFQVWQVPG